MHSDVYLNFQIPAISRNEFLVFLIGWLFVCESGEQ
jgi:hypothetical protein